MPAAALTLSALELRVLLAARYPFAHLITLDASYNVPAADAIDAFNRQLAAHLFDQYGDKWQTYFDCDNFALEGVVLACRKHFIARQAGSGSAEGIALGLLGFQLTPGNPASGHAINFWVDAKKQIHEFDPQNRHPLPLTPAQCASAFFVFV